MSRLLHHMRTPLHVRQNICDAVLNIVQSRVAKGLASSDDLDSLSLLQDVTEHISDAVQMIKDIADLAHFDQGMEYEVNLEKVDLLAFRKACLMGLSFY